MARRRALNVVLGAGVEGSALGSIPTLCLNRKCTLVTPSTAQVSLFETTPSDPKFLTLLVDLDATLAIVNGEQHSFYTQHSQAPTLDFVLLLEVDGEVVGCGGLRQRTERATEVKRMYVRPEYRGHGYAARILAALEQQARKAGFAETLLETAHNLTAANRLYEREGYLRIDNFEPYIGKELSVCYAKEL